VGKFLENIKPAGQNRHAGGKFSEKSINVQGGNVQGGNFLDKFLTLMRPK
jgi:hypothetical protein